ncbi:protein DETOXIFICATION 14-like [Carica papaya]|uniref:protein DETOXIFICATION 14-like n=1 Tax=Carica papaya TaxID=3649 RepID=UPI000B8C9D33|nr:protein DETOXIFICATION 14-like [Carica papaya]
MCPTKERDEEIEKSLLGKDEEEGNAGDSSGITIALMIQEMKKLGYVAGPMVAVNLSQYFLQVIAVMMVGHLGELYLASTALAISFCAVTGFSVIFGMSAALETLCGQAYGAQQYQKLGTHIYTAIVSLNLACFPLSLIWFSMGKLLVFSGQDPLVSKEAGKFAMCLVPALLAYATLQPLVRFFQVQSLVTPLLTSSLVSLCFHVFFCWVSVFKLGLGNLGGALAISLSYWLNVALLGLHMKYLSSCVSISPPFSMDLFKGMKDFFRLAIPSAFMVCLEWWSFEFLTLLSGLMPNPQLETSVLSVCVSTIATLYTIPDGLGAAASTRVSNALGGGKPQAAKLAVGTVLLLAVSEAAIVSSTLFANRRVFGHVFSNEIEVVDYVSSMAPLICLCVVLNSFQATLSGIARGSGRQDLGACVNLGAYYLCGIPVAAFLGFWAQMRGRGLWLGIQVGAFVQTLLLATITCCTNWEKQAAKARERVFGRISSVEDGYEYVSIDSQG